MLNFHHIAVVGPRRKEFTFELISDDYEPWDQDYVRANLIIDGEDTWLQFFYSFPRLDEYTSRFDPYFAETEGVVLLYSITSQQSYEEVAVWREKVIKARGGQACPMVLVGNGCKQETKRKVLTATAREQAAQWKIPFFEASDADWINVEESFFELTREISKKKGVTRTASTKTKKSHSSGVALKSKSLRTAMMKSAGKPTKSASRTNTGAKTADGSEDFYAHIFKVDVPERMKEIEKLTEVVRKTKRVDKIKLSESLGKGSFGEVYLATIEKKSFALKILRSYDDTTLEEFRIHRELFHMNVVTAYYAFTPAEKPGQLWVFLDYCDSDLQKYLDHKDNFTSPIFADDKVFHAWMYQLLNAMSYLHSQNIIHRDLKPGNILLKQEINLANNMKIWVPKICDFGMARKFRHLDSKTVAGNVGTTLYNAPELWTLQYGQAENAYGCIVDIWSLGLVFLQMCVSMNSRLLADLLVKTCSHTTLPAFIPENVPKFVSEIVTNYPEALQLCPFLLDMLAEKSKRKTAAALVCSFMSIFSASGEKSAPSDVSSVEVPITSENNTNSSLELNLSENSESQPQHSPLTALRAPMQRTSGNSKGAQPNTPLQKTLAKSPERNRNSDSHRQPATGENPPKPNKSSREPKLPAVSTAPSISQSVSSAIDSILDDDENSVPPTPHVDQPSLPVNIPQPNLPLLPNPIESKAEDAQVETLEEWCERWKLPETMLAKLAENEITTAEEFLFLSDDDISAFLASCDLKLGSRARFLKALKELKSNA